MSKFFLATLCLFLVLSCKARTEDGSDTKIDKGILDDSPSSVSVMLKPVVRVGTICTGVIIKDVGIVTPNFCKNKNDKTGLSTVTADLVTSRKEKDVLESAFLVAAIPSRKSDEVFLVSWSPVNSEKKPQLHYGTNLVTSASEGVITEIGRTDQGDLRSLPANDAILSKRFQFLGFALNDAENNTVSVLGVTPESIEKLIKK